MLYILTLGLYLSLEGMEIKIFQEQCCKPLSKASMLNLYFRVIPHSAFPENTVPSDDMLPLAHVTPVVRELYHDTSLNSDG